MSLPNIFQVTSAILLTVSGLCGPINATESTESTESIIPAVEAIQDRETIRDTARQFILKHLDGQTGDPGIDVATIDHRLRLPLCATPLEGFLPPGGKAVGVATVGVRCGDGVHGWKLYVRAMIKITQGVVMTRRAIGTGQVIGLEDVVIMATDVSQLRQGYHTELRQVLGKAVKRPVEQDTVLVPNAIGEAEAVSRGAEVMILAANSHLEVRMKGIALQKGIIGEKISVKNLSSQKNLQALVMAPGIVRVDL
ncbi:MAG: flagellar basal body P-ring formation chaperone FlgA [Pseudomonadota bacterium]